MHRKFIALMDFWFELRKLYIPNWLIWLRASKAERAAWDEQPDIDIDMFDDTMCFSLDDILREFGVDDDAVDSDSHR